MSANTRPARLAAMTYEEVEALVVAARGGGARAVVLVPVGSVEPHGPHLPLETDTRISEACAERAARELESEGLRAIVAPSVPYGVTDYASGFAGAIGVPAAALTALLRGICDRLLATGFSHVCLVNNHLEPAHDAAVRAAIVGLPPGAASVACPLTRRWGRTLSDEFKSGACHAGRYETSLVLAIAEDAEDAVKGASSALPAIDLSLSEAIRAGKATFREIGMTRAYTGAPAEATRREGEDLLARLTTMVVTEIREALALRGA
jgi:creatinine amidohydrolase